MAIGDLARRTGTATSALRYYERIGLLPAAERVSGRRYYPPSAAERVALIHLCQDAGFTLAEIRQLLAANHHRRDWRPLAERKIDELDARIRKARQAKKLLQHGLDCRHRNLLGCPQFGAALHARLQATSPGSSSALLPRKPGPQP